MSSQSPSSPAPVVSGSPEPADPHVTAAEPGELDVADLVADAVRAVPGVARLHGGMFGEVATYLVGRRVAGIRQSADGTEVHVSLLLGVPIGRAADQIRRAVRPLVNGPVHVIVEDVVTPEEQLEPDASP
ncbi:MAG: hypothetical protein ACR2KG_12395 [Nocardioidaceae bacterium]